MVHVRWTDALEELDDHHEEKGKGANPRTFMLAENQTKNIWNSLVSVRAFSGTGSILHTRDHCQLRLSLVLGVAYPLVSIPYRFRKSVIR